MIIIGYPGIGKSTLAGRYKDYIDLESSNWNNPDNTKPDNWWWSYGKVAEDLSRQGYRVFVSCHKEIQNYFRESNEEVMICYPDFELRDEWINKLKLRYDKDHSQKNKNALDTAEKFYMQHINDLYLAPFKHKCVLKDINYTLDNELDNFIWSMWSEGKE